MKRLIPILLLALLGLLLADATETVVEIQTQDGNTFIGTIIHEDENVVVLQSVSGAEYRIPVNQISTRRIAENLLIEGDSVQRTDPNYTRYLFLPSAFPMQKKSTHCSDKCLMFPSLSYAFTNRISAHGGFALIPGMSSLPYYVMAKGTLYEGERSAFAIGAEYFSVTSLDVGTGSGFGFGVYTYGNHNSHLTGGLFYGYVKDGDDSDVYDRPMVMLSGVKRMSPRMSFISENWILPGGTSILSGGVRYFTRYLTVDFALFTASDLLEEDVSWPFFPWVGFTYHFDN